MKTTLIVPTNANWDRLNDFKKSLVENTHSPRNIKVIFIDNANTFNHDMKPWINDLQNKFKGSVQLISLPERVGLTTVWMTGTIHSQTNWTIFVNDDILFDHEWDLLFESIIKNKGNDFGCFLLCHPYNWSGFAMSKDFIAEFPWRTEFPEGYYEDNDIYLRVALARGLKTKHDVYTKGIYCVPYNTDSSVYCFKHISHDRTNKSPYYTRWDSTANRLIFEKYWRATSPSDLNAIQNKNGTYFVPVNTDS